jgi:GNAT superfamily N-acetyltransferase
MNVILRDADATYWADLFAWRNDVLTRASSLRSEVVPLTEHLKWLDATLADKTQRTFIAHDVEFNANIGVGRLRRQKSAPNSSMARIELLMTVAPGYRGRGHGLHLVQRLAAKAMEWEDGPLKLTAVVREENMRSLCAFGGFGFVVDRVVAAADDATKRVAHLSFIARK